MGESAKIDERHVGQWLVHNKIHETGFGGYGTGREKDEEVNVEKVLGFIRDKKLVHSSQTYQCVGYNAKLRDWLDERWDKWPENLKKVKQEEPKEDLDDGGDLWAVPSADEEELMSEELDEDVDEEEVKDEQE